MSTFDQAIYDALQTLPPEEFRSLVDGLERWFYSPDDREWLHDRIAAMRAQLREDGAKG